MIRTDLPASDAEPEEGRGFVSILRLAALGLLAIFVAGVLAGFTAAVLDHGVKRPLVAALVIAATIAVMAFAVRYAWRDAQRLYGAATAPAGPRTTKARSAMIGSLVIGTVLGILVGFGGGLGGLFSEGPVTPWVAIVAIALWSVATPLLTLFWWRNIDEHEAQAYRTGALVGIMAYAAIAPGWWMAWRAGLMPRPQEMITFVIVITVWGLVWAWQRYR